MNGEKQKIDAHKWPRDPNDWYIESKGCSLALFKAEKFGGRPIMDPSAGVGRIVEAAKGAGYEAWGLDLKDRMRRKYAKLYTGIYVHGGFDFMADDWTSQVADRFDMCSGASRVFDIVSNPPFKHCAPRGYKWENPDREPLFVDLALERMRRKCALFLPAKYLASASRWGWLETTPLKKIYHIVPRPSMPPGDALLEMIRNREHPGNGQQDFVCLVWERGYRGDPASLPLNIASIK